MEYKRPKCETKWPVLDGPERAREADQLKLITKLMHRMYSGNVPEQITNEMVRHFLQACDLYGRFEQVTHNDSTFRLEPGMSLPPFVPMDTIMEFIDTFKDLRPVCEIPGIDQANEIAELLNNYKLKEIDEKLILALDEVCEREWTRTAVQEQCSQALEGTVDAVQRAKLFLDMDREDEAYREFKKISSEEIKNPENALPLVELVEFFQNKVNAVRILKRWFLFEIILHPLTQDLIASILFSDSKQKESARLVYIRRLLAKAEFINLEELRDQMTLAIPSKLQFKISEEEIEKRLSVFGINLVNLDMFVDDSEPICLYSLLMDLCSQLNHLATLASETNRTILALNALERCLFCSFVLVFLPPRIEDIQQVIGYGHYNSCYEWTVQNLQESISILESIEIDTIKERELYLLLNRELDQFNGIMINLAEEIKNSDVPEFGEL